MERLARTLLRHRIIWLVLIAIVTAALGANLGKLTTEEDETTWFPPNDRTLAVFSDFEDRFSSDEIIVVAYEWDDPFSPASLLALRHLTRRLAEEVPYVADATSLTTVEDIVGTESALTVRPLLDSAAFDRLDLTAVRQRIAQNPFIAGTLISDDERVVSVLLDIERPDGSVFEEASTRIISALSSVLADEARQTGADYRYAGSAITERAVERTLDADIIRFFPLTLAFSAGLLLLFFRRVASLILPLLIVILSLIWTLGLKALLGSPITPVSTSLIALVTVIAVATSVHLISQYWLEVPHHPDRLAVLLATYRRSGKPCLFTTLTTAVGFGSLAVSRIPAIRNLGIFAAFGILSAFFLSMVLVPQGMDWASRRQPRAPENRWVAAALRGIGRFNLRHPWIVVVAFVALVGGMAAGIPRIQSAGSMVDYFKPASAVRQSIDFLDKHLSGVSSTEVLLSGPRDSFKDPAVLRTVADLQDFAEAHPFVTTTYSTADTVKLINRALHADDPAYDAIPETKAAVSQSILLYEMSGGGKMRAYVSGDYSTARVSIMTRQMPNSEREALLADVRSLVDERLPDLTAEITGWDRLIAVVNDRIVSTQIQSLALAALVIAAMMILVFGWRAGLLSIVPNVLPIVFVLGLMGYGHFGLNIATAIIASIAIGIVVDDTIHYFSHFRDEFLAVRDRKLAMVGALNRVGRALIFTTAILSAGFAVNLFAELGIMASYGILSGAAVLVALLGDLFVGPVLLANVPVFSALPPSKRARSR